jgi:hypothetical protein
VRRLVPHLVADVAIGCLILASVIQLAQLWSVMKSYRRDIVLVFRGKFTNQAKLPAATFALYVTTPLLVNSNFSYPVLFYRGNVCTVRDHTTACEQ